MRFDFTQKHIDLFNKVMNGVAVTFITHSTPDVIMRSWLRLKTECGQSFTKDDWETYLDGFMRIQTVLFHRG